MTRAESIEAKVDFCVSALKYLLANMTEHGEAMVEDDPDGWDDEGPLDEIERVVPEDDGQVMVPVFTKHETPADLCKTRGHNQQVYVQGKGIICGRCGEPLISSGVVQNKLSSGGQVIPDPNPPAWARERSPGASSKNPGTPLVPHS